jgi:hypothetical protein
MGMNFSCLAHLYTNPATVSLGRFITVAGKVNWSLYGCEYRQPKYACSSTNALVNVQIC